LIVLNIAELGNFDGKLLENFKVAVTYIEAEAYTAVYFFNHRTWLQ